MKFSDFFKKKPKENIQPFYFDLEGRIRMGTSINTTGTKAIFAFKYLFGFSCFCFICSCIYLLYFSGHYFADTQNFILHSIFLPLTFVSTTLSFQPIKQEIDHELPFVQKQKILNDRIILKEIYWLLSFCCILNFLYPYLHFSFLIFVFIVLQIAKISILKNPYLSFTKPLLFISNIDFATIALLAIFCGDTFGNKVPMLYLIIITAVFFFVLITIFDSVDSVLSPIINSPTSGTAPLRHQTTAIILHSQFNEIFKTYVKKENLEESVQGIIQENNMYEKKEKYLDFINTPDQKANGWISFLTTFTVFAVYLLLMQYGIPN